MPVSLIHNDFNPRNIALRRDREGRLALSAYDWELATLGPPQHDLAELLSFVLVEPSREEVDHYVEIHRQALERESGIAIPARGWREGYALCLRHLAIDRFAFYLMAHTFRQYGFLERTLRTLHRLLHMEEGVRV